ncbi:MAG: Thiol-disulfide isomerase or thioredoxin, partial [Chitinophagaceae bacterium]|nr:Thiol-disulfide isomerase or thioredoxin [Chitinophagaceae bacterium]
MRRKSCHILLLLTGWLYIPTAALCKDPIKNAVEISNKLTDTSTLRTLPPVSLFLDKSFLSKKDDNVGFIYHDSVAFGHPVSLTKEKTSIYINAPILIQLGKNQALYLIYPGEQIQMKADENNSFVLSIEGNYQRTNELNFFRQLTKKTGSIFPYNPFFDTISYHKKVESLLQLEAVGKVINNLMTSRLKFLDSFSTAVKVSGGFREIAKNSITVAALQDSLVLYYQNKEMLKQLNVFDSTLYEKKRSVMNIPFYALFYFLRTYDMFR